MNYLSGATLAIGLTIASMIYPQQTSAEAFTGNAFLGWSESQQLSYLNAQIVMASSIVARAKPDMSQCMADQFYGAKGLTDEQFRELIKAIGDYETYYPSSILVVEIENECGKFY